MQDASISQSANQAGDLVAFRYLGFILPFAVPVFSSLAAPPLPSPRRHCAYWVLLESMNSRVVTSSLGEHYLTTIVPWSEGADEYRGVPLYRLLDALNYAGDELTFIGRDGSVVGISLQEALRSGAFVAYQADGEPLSARL